MKKLVCEICQCTEFSKDNGLFICRGCGLQYSTEEVKKIMVEVADNYPTSRPSNVPNQRLINLYTRARKSLEVDDLEHAAEYYKQIIDENPNDWEAYFYSYLGETTNYTNAQAASVAGKLSTTIPPAYDMAIAYGSQQDKVNRVLLISSKTAERLTEIAFTAKALLSQYENGFALGAMGQVKSGLYRNLRPTAQSTVVNCVVAFDSLLEKIEEIFQGKKAIDESTYIESVLILRKAQVALADMTFAPMAGLTEKFVKEEALNSYKRSLSNAERYAADVARRVAEQKAAYEAEQARKEWELRQARKAAYWESHPEEKAVLEQKKQNLENERAQAIQKINETKEEIGRLANEGNVALPEEEQLAQQNQKIDALKVELGELGAFKGKEKKTLKEQIDAELQIVEDIKRQVEESKQNRNKQISEQIAPLQTLIAQETAKIQGIDNEIKAIFDEFNADR